MIGVISLPRDTGKRAGIRVDEIASWTENETKVDGKATPCLTIFLRNNVAWHFLITEKELVQLLAGAGGEQFNVIRIEDFIKN